MLRLFLIFLLQLTGISHAAEFSRILTKSGSSVLGISGEINPDDGQRFADYATDKEALVILESSGGNVLAALIIGEHIRAKGYATFVLPDSVCASACGLIWLAGAPRGGTETSKLGFHAASRNGEVVSSSNALIGAYLSKMGISYRAIQYITEAAPRQMAWLTFAKAKELGIEIVPIDLSKRDEPVGLGGRTTPSSQPPGGATASAPREPAKTTSSSIRLTCAPLIREGRDPVVTAEVSRVEDHWTIIMTTMRGARYNRGQQYEIRRKPGSYSWFGAHIKKRDTTIHGEINLIGGNFFYSEKIFSNGNLVADLGYRCEIRR